MPVLTPVAAPEIVVADNSWPRNNSQPWVAGIAKIHFTQVTPYRYYGKEII